MKDEITKKLLITKLKGNEDIVSIIINKLNENEKNNFDEQYLPNKIINFGKYKGRNYGDILLINPYYIKWVVEKTNIIKNPNMKNYLILKSNLKIDTKKNNYRYKN